MPKINVYLPDELAASVREAQLPVSGICQAALERAVRDISSARGTEEPPRADRRAPGLYARFTVRAREAMNLAENAARDVPHDYVGTEHVLLGILAEGHNLAIRVLTSLDIEVDDLRAEIMASMAPPAQPVDGHIPFTQLAKHALERTAKEALTLGHNYIGCEHLLLGLLATDDGLASQVMRRMGLELRTTRRAVTTVLAGVVHAQYNPTAPPANRPDALTQILQRLDAIEARLPS